MRLRFSSAWKKPFIFARKISGILHRQFWPNGKRLRLTATSPSSSKVHYCKIIYLDGWKPVPLPESTQSRSGPYGTEPDTNISPFEFPEISYWLDIKYIVLSVSFCQAQVAFVSNKLVMLCQFHHYSSVSTYKGSDWYRATKSDYFPAGAVRHSEWLGMKLAKKEIKEIRL